MGPRRDFIKSEMAGERPISAESYEESLDTATRYEVGNEERQKAGRWAGLTGRVPGPWTGQRGAQPGTRKRRRAGVRLAEWRDFWRASREERSPLAQAQPGRTNVECLVEIEERTRRESKVAGASDGTASVTRRLPNPPFRQKTGRG